MSTLVINLISAVAAIITMINAYLLSQGRLRPTYILSSAKNLAYIGLNLTLFIADPERLGILLLTIPAVWGIVMSGVGLRRLIACTTRRENVPND